VVAKGPVNSDMSMNAPTGFFGNLSGNTLYVRDRQNPNRSGFCTLSGSLWTFEQFAGSGLTSVRFNGMNLEALAFNTLSDRNAKQGIEPADAGEILDKVVNLPVSEWSYSSQPEVRHVGPMAQDFKAAFGLGDDEKRISLGDAQGVALAAIQGLHQRMQEEIARRDAVIRKLEERLAALEQRTTSKP
jgi:hypothetical protein